MEEILPERREKQDGELILEDLRTPIARMQYWDQLHKVINKFTEPKYEKCSDWITIEERVLSTYPAEQILKWPKWKSWVGGIYEFYYEGENQRLAIVKLHFDWPIRDDNTEEDRVSIKWRVELLRRDRDVDSTAYPGTHHGSIEHSWHQPECYELTWDVPIFSPYVWVGSRDDWKPTLLGAREGPVLGVSEAEDWHARLATEEVQFAGKLRRVLVLEKLMRSVCTILLFGPTYTDVPPEYVPTEKIKRKNSIDRPALGAFFERGVDFQDAARFFSRAYNVENEADGSRRVTEEEKKATVKSVQDLLGHFKISQPPFWVTDANWPDQLSNEVQGVKTFDEWRRLERDWATLTSYACALSLHEGPWAGERWKDFVAEPMV